MRRDRQRLLDVIEAIEEIEKYADRGKPAFEADDLLQTFIVHHIQILGEACRSISPELTANNPQVPWSKIVGMRHILVHHYFRIDVDAVWNVVENEIPTLKRQIREIIGALGTE